MQTHGPNVGTLKRGAPPAPEPSVIEWPPGVGVSEHEIVVAVVRTAAMVDVQLSHEPGRQRDGPLTRARLRSGETAVDDCAVDADAERAHV
jgi:hypothetical protein